MKREILNINNRKRGVTLLLVILVASALMAISLGIFNITFIELRISGELSNTFQALYASDQLIEYVLYRDRITQDACASSGGENCFRVCTTNMPNCTGTEEFASLNGACGDATVSKGGGLTVVKSIGQFQCDPTSQRVVKRAFELSY